MCGIVGYVGKKGDATRVLIDGLRALEYRGYDSAGIYLEGSGATKRVGKVGALASALPPSLSGTAGIAHTRWATHGVPSEENAHPHTDPSETVWLVHNGIIENHAELREELAERGAAFRSETDTEVLAALIGSLYQEGTLLEDAIRAALARVRGTYGLAVMSAREPGKIVAARLGSPLMLGIGADGRYLASDATPILPHTREVVYLDDGDLAILTADSHEVRRLDGASIDRPLERLEWDIEAAQKKGHEHFMLKEMLEIPEVIENTLRGRIIRETGEANLGGLRAILPRLARAERIVITGCGSAYYAGLVGEMLIEELAGIPVEVEIASELRYRRFTMNPERSVLIAVSQSGETLDTLEAVREAKRHGMLTIGIVNVVGSSIAREIDAGVYNHAGPEIGVASTKAFVSQMAVLALVALLLGRDKGLSQAEGIGFARELERLPALARRALAERTHVAALAKRYADVENAFYLGRKFAAPIALEGALKLKEISYIHAEGYEAGEMKHGPIALVDDRFLTVALAPKDSLFEKTRSNVAEIRARGGRALIITTEGNGSAVRTLADDIITVPEAREELLPALMVIPLQLFAYFVAKEHDCPIDQPRNLAKSVTVE